MQITHVYKDYHPVLGGIENHIKTLAELQADHGHEVRVLVTNPGSLPAYEVIRGVQVHRLPRLATVASTPLTPAFLPALFRSKPDITHLHFPYPVGEVSQLLAGKQPYVITYHSDVVRQETILRFYKPILEKVLRSAARILPTSQPYIASSGFLQPVQGKCRVVPLSVDTERFAQAAPILPAVSETTLLFVGRHRYYKGVDDLIRALPGLNARLLIGGGGPMRMAWENLTDELGLGNRVQFLGNVPDADLPGLYASADIFVLPANARAEAFGKVLLEAMASGLPCVTTELGTGTSFVVQDGTTGLVVPPRSPEQLREALNFLIAHPEKRLSMGEAGRLRVAAEFTPTRLYSRVDEIYRQVLAEIRQPRK
jgi:rhamnosyl/mannosyltransferase